MTNDDVLLLLSEHEGRLRHAVAGKGFTTDQMRLLSEVFQAFDNADYWLGTHDTGGNRR